MISTPTRRKSDFRDADRWRATMSNFAPRGRQLTGEERVIRDHRIRVDLAKGLAWVTVAERYGLTERQLRNIWRDRTSSQLFHAKLDPEQELRDELELLAALMAEAAELGELTLNDAVRLGTIRTRLAIQERRIELKRLYGVLPWGHEHLQLRSQVEEMIDSLIEILTRHRVSEAVYEDIALLSEAEHEQSRKRLRSPLLPALESNHLARSQAQSVDEGRTRPADSVVQKDKNPR
jgi:hypothetical protein